MALEKILNEEIATSEIIMTRFGKIHINKEKALNFPEGILGIEGIHKYCLADYPENKLPLFKVLQAVDNLNVAFLVLPVTNVAETYKKEHLDECFSDLQIRDDNAVVVLIASIHKGLANEKSKLTVNVRAPIIIDTANMIAYQYVFKYDNYSIQNELN
ncbi:MAG: flagellar assembly protein FliW [Alphaproteobacteria bacterium]|nr:flagellar assembly protein FliW [Alphaproteobacteria bacterium]OJV15111.1 MAG: hypothetical protein BGO27_06705 [Alphaproteobacteria bacterium 33-17]